MPLKTKLKIALFAGLFIIFIVLLFLPATFFDEGQSICLSVVLFDMECYGCGMTRAIQHLIHFDYKAAYEFNILSFVVLPLIAYLIIVEVIKTYKEIRSSNASTSDNAE